MILMMMANPNNIPIELEIFNSKDILHYVAVKDIFCSDIAASLLNTEAILPADFESFSTHVEQKNQTLPHMLVVKLGSSVVGICGVSALWAKDAHVSIYIALTSIWQRRGLGTAITNTFTRFVEETMKPLCVVIETKPDNLAMQKTALKCGYEYMGIINNKHYDKSELYYYKYFTSYYNAITK